MKDRLSSKQQYVFLKAVRAGRVSYIPPHELGSGAEMPEQFVGGDVKGPTAFAQKVREYGWIWHGKKYKGEGIKNWQTVRLTPLGRQVLEEAEEQNRFGDRKPLAKSITTAEGVINLRNDGDTLSIEFKERGKMRRKMTLAHNDALELSRSISFMLSTLSLIHI